MLKNKFVISFSVFAALWSGIFVAQTAQALIWFQEPPISFPVLPTPSPSALQQIQQMMQAAQQTAQEAIQSILPASPPPPPPPPQPATIQGQLSPIAEQLGGPVYHYDEQRNDWDIYDPNAPSYVNTYLAIAPGDEVYINTNEDTVLGQVSLQQGWNTVQAAETTGYQNPPAGTQTLDTVGLDITSVSLWGQDPQNPSGPPVELYNPSTPSNLLPPDLNIEAGNGYWVNNTAGFTPTQTTGNIPTTMYPGYNLVAGATLIQDTQIEPSPAPTPTPPPIAGPGPTPPTYLGPAPPLTQPSSGASSGGGALPPPPPIVEQYEDYFDPCDGVVCNPYCSGDTAFYGVCQSGACRYSTQNCAAFGLYCFAGECVSVRKPTVQTVGETWDYRSAPLQPILSWRYTDPQNSPQKTYRVQAVPYSQYSSWWGAVASPVDTFEVTSPSTAYTILPGVLEFNQRYGWRVQSVQNQLGVYSEISNIDEFTTPLHQYPQPDFSWTPSKPTPGEIITFKDQTTWYNSDPQNRSWLWTIPDAQYVQGTSPSSQNPVVKFQTRGDKTVTLKATDLELQRDPNSGPGDNSITKTVKMGFSFPSWQEILPW